MATVAEIRIGLDREVIAIPYRPEKHVDGETFPYRSLLEEPSAINDIPELQGELHLKRFVAAVNAPGGTFETFRVQPGLCRKNGRWRPWVSVGLLFRDRRLFREYSNYVALAGNFLQYLAQAAVPLELDTVPLLDLQQARLKDETLDGWVCDLYVSAQGSSELAGRTRLGTVLDSLAGFLRTGLTKPD